jgi:hypothetical protein
LRQPGKARAVQVAGPDPIRRSSTGRSPTKDRAREDRTRLVQWVHLTASQRWGHVRVPLAQGLVLAEPHRTRESRFCPTSSRPATTRGVLLQVVPRNGSWQRSLVPLVGTARRLSQVRAAPEADLAPPSRPRPGWGPTWPGPATPISRCHLPQAMRRRRGRGLPPRVRTRRHRGLPPRVPPPRVLPGQPWDRVWAR